MAKARELLHEDLQANPLLRDLLESARVSGEQIVRYQGLTVLLQPVEDITHTFSQEELQDFIKAYDAAEDPAKRLTAAEALARFKSKANKHG